MIELSAESIQTLQDLASRIKAARAEIERAKRAGLNVAEHEAALDQYDALREGLLAQYGRRRQARRAAG